jgi:carbonic anhydrase
LKLNKLIVVLGHTECGVAAAVERPENVRHIATLINEN